LCAGLDPAGPLFENVGPSGRLDAGDAVLVVIIYTSSGCLALTECIGHVCFYPNRGTWPQPGCGILDLSCESVCVKVHLPLYRSPERRRSWTANC